MFQNGGRGGGDLNPTLLRRPRLNKRRLVNRKNIVDCEKQLPKHFLKKTNCNLSSTLMDIVLLKMAIQCHSIYGHI
jgi:hypothetical protein